MPQRGSSKKSGSTIPKTASKEERPQHYIYIEKSHTKNLENYNSAKITVGITVQVNPTPQELKDIKKTIEIADELLDEEMVEQLKEFES